MVTPGKTIGKWVIRAITAAIILHSPWITSAQPIPEGPRLRDLADRAGLLIGVRTLGIDDTYNTIVEREFNTGTSTYYARWDRQHVGIGQYDFHSFNTKVNWLSERGMKPMQHMLFGPDQYEPSWVVALTSAQSLESLMQDRIRSIMESNDNKTKVNVWNVVNESLQWSGSDGSYFPESGDKTALVIVKLGWEEDASGLTGEDKINDRHPVFIRKAFTYAAQYAAGKLELRDNTIERPSRKSRAFYQLVRHLKNSGVKIDGVGLQCHFDLDGPNKLDTAGLAAEIKKYRDLGLEVYLNEVDIGCTTKIWNEQVALQQKEEYKKLMAVALRAGVNQVHFWGLRDDDENWRKGEHPLLFAADNTPKPAYYGVQEALIEFLEETGNPDVQRGLSAYWPVVAAPFDVAAGDAPQLGTGEFSVAMWMQSDEVNDRLPGDLLSQYDPARRRGFHVTLKCNPGVASNQANWRHLQFGIDDDRQTPWRDCGRPGNAILAFALAVDDGSLYAGTCEPGQNESGRVYQYDDRGNRWLDCGAPDGSNAVTALAVYQGRLYAGTGKYRLAGSALPESENLVLGGRVFRYDGDRHWTDCGQLPDTEAVGGLVVYRGLLYASSLYRPAGFFRFDGPSNWRQLPVPELRDPTTSAVSPQRVEALTVYNGFLYASSYDGGHVYRFDGQQWSDCGQLGDNTQTYSFAQYAGHLHTGTWPSGRVYRWDETMPGWIDVGRLGEEREVMGMLVHNGRLIAGTLPLAEVYSYEGGETWKRLTRLDHTPDVTYRRVWTMAEHGGEVFCSTLPSGHVYAFSAGRQVAWESSLSAEWHHVAAIKSHARLTLYVDGRQVAETAAFDADSYNLDNSAPLRIGNGANGPWQGKIQDLRVYQRALSAAEIDILASSTPSR